MLKELPSITPPLDSFWKEIMDSLSDNPDSIIPVIVKDPASGLNAGRFYASLARQENGVFLQVENVSEHLCEEIDSRGWGDGWETLIGGIYRLPITSPLLNS